jgi:hypothetical protein
MKNTVSSIVFCLFLFCTPHFLKAIEAGPVEIHGFASQGVLASSANNYLGDSSDGEFRFTEAAINGSMLLFDRVRVGAQIFAFQLGELGDLEPSLDWAFADYQFNSWIGLRAGRVKLPSGLHNEYLDLDIVRPWVLLPQAVYDARWRDFIASVDGGLFYGAIELGAVGTLDYQIYGGVTSVGGDSGVADFFEDRNLLEVRQIEVDHVFGYSLSWVTPIDGLRVVHSYFFGRDVTFDGPFKSAEQLGFMDAQTAFLFTTPLETPGNPLGALIPTLEQVTGNPDAGALSASDYLSGSPVQVATESAEIRNVGLEYFWGDWTFNAEYQQRNAKVFYDVKNPLTPVFGAAVPLLSGAEARYIKQEGFYASAAYRINEMFEVGTYYSQFHNSRDNRSGASWEAIGQPASLAWQKDWAVAVRADLHPQWTLKVEMHWIDGTDLLFNHQGQNPINERDPSWTLFTAKTSFNF